MLESIINPKKTEKGPDEFITLEILKKERKIHLT
jgi:hypothetical protein